MPAFYEVVIEARDAASGTFQKVAREARRAQQEVDRGFLDNLKGSFGGRSDFKEGAELLAGGGALVGLSFVGNWLNDLTESAKKQIDAFHKGEKSFNDLAEAAIKGLPVFGSFVKAGENLAGIIESFTDEAAAHRQQQALAEQFESFRTAVRAAETRTLALDETLAEFDRSVADNKTASDRRRELFEAEIRRLDAIQSAAEKADPTSGARTLIEDRKFQAQERLDRDLADIAAKEAEALPGKIDARLDAFFGPVDQAGGQFGTAAEQLKETTDRIDSALEGFFGQVERDAEFFERGPGRPGRTDPRFASAVESRGTGIGALARGGVDPALDVARDTNRTQKQANEIVAAGFSDLSTKMAEFIEAATNGYPGANA